MRSLDQMQKPNWPIYLSSLVFAYNATPHSTTGHLWWSLTGGEVRNMCHILRGRCEP